MGGLEVLPILPPSTGPKITRPVNVQEFRAKRARPVTIPTFSFRPRRRRSPRRQELPARRGEREREMTGGQVMKRIPRIKFPQRRPNPPGNFGSFLRLLSARFAFLFSPSFGFFNPVVSCPLLLPGVVVKLTLRACRFVWSTDWLMKMTCAWIVELCV